MWRSLRTAALMSGLLAIPANSAVAQFEWSAEKYERSGSFLSDASGVSGETAKSDETGGFRETRETSTESVDSSAAPDAVEGLGDEPLPMPQGVQPRTDDGPHSPPITEPVPPEASLGRTYSLPDIVTENRFTTMGYDVYRGAVAGIKPYVPSLHGIAPTWPGSPTWPWSHHHHHHAAHRPFKAFGGTSGLNDFTRDLGAGAPGCGPEGCGPAASGISGSLATSPWFGGVQALMLQRSDTDNLTLAETAGDPVLSTGDANTNLGAGIDVQFGRYLANGRAIEAIYWGTYPSDQNATITPADTGGAINTDLAFNRLVYNNGLGTNFVSNWFGAAGGARFQSVERGFTAHNLEVNYLWNPHRRGQPIHYEWLVGARYLNLDDDLRYLSSSTASVPGADPANELAYNIDVDNHLVGAQLGGRVDYCFASHPHLSAHMGGKLGLFGNRVSQQQSIRGGGGLAISSVSGDPFDVQSSNTGAAFVGDFLVGLAYQCRSNWRITGGYRATTAAGIATSTGQIPNDFTKASVIDADDTLLLHGIYIGGEYNR